MKKKMNILLTAAITAIMLAACGSNETATNEEKTSIEVASTENQKVEEEPTSTFVEPTETLVGWQELYKEWVFDKDIDMSIIDENVITQLPELKLMLPCKKDAEEVETYGNGYIIVIKGTESEVRVSVGLSDGVQTSTETGLAPWYERTDYGRYYVDIYMHKNLAGYLTFIIQDFEAEISYIITFSGGNIDYKKNMDADDAESYATLIYDNIEYIKEQVAGWDGSSAMPAYDSRSANNEVFNSEDEWVQGYIDAFYGTYSCAVGYATIEIVRNPNGGNDTIIAVDTSNNQSYECELVPAGDNYFQAMLSGEVVLHIEPTEKGLFIDTDSEEYSNLYGDYTKE